MNVVKLAAIIGLLGFYLPSLAQLTYCSAAALPLFGKISDQTETRYERLPVVLKAHSRKPVWDLGKNTAGLYLRFHIGISSFRELLFQSVYLSLVPFSLHIYLFYFIF